MMPKCFLKTMMPLGQSLKLIDRVVSLVQVSKIKLASL